MPEILQDLSASALTAAIEDNLYAFTPVYCPWPGVEVYTGEELTWSLTDIALPPCNVIFRARLKPEETAAAIDAAIARGRQRNVPLQWWTGRDTRPADLGERLVASGFRYEGDGTGMAVDIADLGGEAPVPRGLEIVAVSDRQTLETWCRVCAAGLGMPDHAGPALLEWFTIAVEMELPWKIYLAVWDGRPVATSLVFFAAGVAGIYCVATLPEARGRGIGYAVTRRPLLAARGTGYRVGILHASEMGRSVYRRLGFREYSQVSAYVWPNEGP